MTEEEGQDEEGVRSDVARFATTSQLRALFLNNNVNTLNTTDWSSRQRHDTEFHISSSSMSSQTMAGL